MNKMVDSQTKLCFYVRHKFQLLSGYDDNDDDEDERDGDGNYDGDTDEDDCHEGGQRSMGRCLLHLMNAARGLS